MDKNELISMARVEKPWGEEAWVNTEMPICKVKIISVKKGESLSLQFHRMRYEYWKILEGSADVIIGDKQLTVKAGDEVFVPINEKHRMSTTNENCVFLEVASGRFDEEDIVRLEDKYGRIKKE